LKSDYKNPQQIGHWVLSDRIGKRDPGNKPKPGDRIKYLFIPNKDRKALTGNKIETPEYIIANNLNIDYAHYITNQLMKPLQQLFSLAVEEIWTLQKKQAAIKKYRIEIQKLYEKYPDDLEAVMKEREKIASAKVKTLLFDKFLKIIDKQQTKAFALESNHSIESFMTRR
jgi:DNA polymerase elongation subunit (family B)